jgi:hypothetical protein
MPPEILKRFNVQPQTIVDLDYLNTYLNINPSEPANDNEVIHSFGNRTNKSSKTVVEDILERIETYLENPPQARRTTFHTRDGFTVTLTS